ncbi:MAG: hypothetical protein HOQ33_00505 [Cupriavidus sp.]|nr:hypothetical protein [Cupriavidus sp.]
MKIRQITPAIGAEISGVNLGQAARDPALFAEIRSALLRFKVLSAWQQDDVAVWDNRSTQHYAVNDYYPAPRKLERAGIVGDIPC